MVKVALRGVHGKEKIAEFSDYHLVNDVWLTYTTKEIVIEQQEWKPFCTTSPKKMANTLITLAKKVDLKRYPKKKRGLKKARPANRKSGIKN